MAISTAVLRVIRESLDSRAISRLSRILPSDNTFTYRDCSNAIRIACRIDSSKIGSPVRLSTSASTTQSRSAKAIAGSGRSSSQPPSTSTASTRPSAASTTGCRHRGRSRRALALERGMRSGADPISPTSITSCTTGTPLKRQRPCDFHSRRVPRSPSASVARWVSDSATADNRIWPGRASIIRRAAIGLARPSTSIDLAPARTASGLLSQVSTSPTCRPARARSSIERCWPSACSSRW